MATPGGSDFSRRPFVFGDKGAPLLQVRGGLLSPESFMTYFMGEGWGKVRVTFPLLLVSQTPSAGNIHYAKVPYLGLVHPDPTEILHLLLQQLYCLSLGRRYDSHLFWSTFPPSTGYNFYPFGVERKGNRDSKVLN